MTRLNVTWDNPGHDALSGERGRMEVELYRGTSTEDFIPGDESPGRKTWDLTREHGTIRLVFNVDYTPFPRSNFRHVTHPRSIRSISISQPLEIMTAAPGLRVHGAADPRLHIDGHSSEAVIDGEQLRGNVVNLHVDTRFLDVTSAYATARYPLRMVQFTGGAPHTWAIYIPDHADATELDWLVFFRPVHRISNRYVEDVEYYPLDRYTLTRLLAALQGCPRVLYGDETGGGESLKVVLEHLATNPHPNLMSVREKELASPSPLQGEDR